MDLLAIAGLIARLIAGLAVLLVVTLPNPRGNRPGPKNPTPCNPGHIDLIPSRRKPKPEPIHMVIDCHREVRPRCPPQ